MAVTATRAARVCEGAGTPKASVVSTGLGAVERQGRRGGGQGKGLGAWETRDCLWGAQVDNGSGSPRLRAPEAGGLVSGRAGSQLEEPAGEATAELRWK